MKRALDPVTEAAFARQEDALTALHRAANERVLLIDGAMGTQIQCLGLNEGHFRGNRFHSCERHLQGNNDLLTLDSAAGDRRHPFFLCDGGRGHSRNQYFFLDLDRAGRLRDAGVRLRAQSRRGATGAAGGDQGGKGRRPPPFRRRRAGADEPHRVALPGRQQSGLPRGHLRRVAHRLRRAASGAHRWRRRPRSDRDHFRHPQRQGGNLRLFRGVC